MEEIAKSSSEQKGILKHTPKIQFVLFVLGVIYFSLAIYLATKQIKKVNGN